MELKCFSSWNYYKVHPSPCIHAFIGPGKRVFLKFCITCLALVRLALLGVVRLGGSYYRKVYLPSGVAGICPLVFLFFTRCVFQHFVYFLYLDYHPYPIWTPWWLARFSHTQCLVGAPFSYMPPNTIAP